MIDERRLLERAADSVAPPQRVMDTLHRRRERKLRNRRLGALALAACLTIALVAGVIEAIHGAERQQPESSTITPGNVGALQQISADKTWPQQGFRTATGDGILAIGTSTWRQPRANAGQLIVYPFPCAGTDAPCTPLWRAPLDGPGMPTVADGSVFVAGLQGHTLYAFPDRCASDGSACDPTWTARIPAWSSSQPPLVVTDGGTARVYVGTMSGVLGFDLDCGSNGDRCSPDVSIPLAHPARVLIYDDALLYIGMGMAGRPDPHDFGSVRVLSLPCIERGGDGCVRWSKQVGQVWDLAVDAVGLYVGSNGGSRGIQAYPIACVRSGADCRPAWTASTDCCTQLTVANGVVYADDQTSHAYAFSTTCSADGAACEPLWTSSGVLGTPYVDFERPIVSGDLVFVGGDEGWIYSFDRACSGSCVPSSRTFITDQAGIPGIWDARVSGDRLYVATEDGLHVYAPGSPRAVDVPSAGGAPIFLLALVLVGGTGVVISIRRRRRMRL